VACLVGALSVEGGLSAGPVPRAGADVPPAGTWVGTIEGSVFGAPFALPVSVEVGSPRRDETNPLHVAIQTDAGGPVPGTLFLSSAEEYVTPETGRIATLTYFTVRPAGAGIAGTLADSHTSEAAAINQFEAPNLSCTYQPPACVPGPEQMYLQPGAVFSLTAAGSQMIGTVVGEGSGLIQILPYPPVSYTATLRATLSAVGSGPSAPSGTGTRSEGTAPPEAEAPVAGPPPVALVRGAAPVRDGLARLAARCPGTSACQGVAKLLGAPPPRHARGTRRRPRTLLGHSSFSISADTAGAVEIPLDRAGRLRLRRAPGHRLRVQLVGRGIRHRPLVLHETGRRR
jgi:hypothetical protein